VLGPDPAALVAVEVAEVPGLARKDEPPATGTEHLTCLDVRRPAFALLLVAVAVALAVVDAFFIAHVIGKATGRGSLLGRAAAMLGYPRGKVWRCRAG
jgi:hypothetical protein